MSKDNNAPALQTDTRPDTDFRRKLGEHEFGGETYEIWMLHETLPGPFNLRYIGANEIVLPWNPDLNAYMKKKHKDAEAYAALGPWIEELKENDESDDYHAWIVEAFLKKTEEDRDEQL